MPTAFFDPDAVEVCADVQHATRGRGDGKVNINDAWYCIRDANERFGVRAWSSHIVNGIEHLSGLYRASETGFDPATDPTWTGPKALTELAGNDFPPSRDAYDVILRAEVGAELRLVLMRFVTARFRGDADYRQRVRQELAWVVDRIDGPGNVTVDVYGRGV